MTLISRSNWRIAVGKSRKFEFSERFFLTFAIHSNLVFKFVVVAHAAPRPLTHPPCLCNSSFVELWTAHSNLLKMIIESMPPCDGWQTFVHSLIFFFARPPAHKYCWLASIHRCVISKINHPEWEKTSHKNCVLNFVVVLNEHSFVCLLIASSTLGFIWKIDGNYRKRFRLVIVGRKSGNRISEE